MYVCALGENEADRTLTELGTGQRGETSLNGLVPPLQVLKKEVTLTSGRPSSRPVLKVPHQDGAELPINGPLFRVVLLTLGVHWSHLGGE